jgi:hypothetical protein
LSDLDTATGDQGRPPARETTPTARHTTSLKPLPERSADRVGRKRLWWLLAGAAVLTAAAGGGLLLTGVLPLKAPKTTIVSQVVQSAAGWQSVAKAPVQQGDRVTVRFVPGEWTVDYRNLPMTGPTGYDANTDRSLDGAMNCKTMPTAPFGTLLARLSGKQDSAVLAIGRKLTIQAAGNGTLRLSIKDTAGACSQDNRGELTAQVSVTHQP